jgi:polar amino acid transport system substrate-binding protein
MSSAAQSWRRLVLAGTALAALPQALACCGRPAAARRHGGCRPGAAAGAAQWRAPCGPAQLCTPALPGEPAARARCLRPGPGGLAGPATGHQHQNHPRKRCRPGARRHGAAERPTAADRQTGGSYMPQSLQLLVLKQQPPSGAAMPPVTGAPGCRMWRRRPPPDPRPASPRVRPLPAPCRPRA